MPRKHRGFITQVLSFGIENPIPVNLIVVMLTVLGLFFAFTLKREIFPRIDFDIVEVSIKTEHGGSPEDIDQNVNQIIYPHLKTINGIKKISSTASNGRGVFKIELEKGTDVDTMRDKIQSSVSNINNLPDGVKIERVKEITSSEDAMFIAISSLIPGKYSMEYLTNTAKDLANELKNYQIASQVDVLSPTTKEIAIEIPIEAMQGRNVSLQLIANAIRSNDVEMYGGTIKSDKEIAIKTSSRRYSKKSIKNIPIKFANGEVLSLQEFIGSNNVKENFDDDSPYFIFNGNEAAVLVVKKGDSEDLIDLCDGISSYINDRALDDGIVVSKFFDTSKHVKERIQLIVKNAIFGFFLILIILALFLQIEVGIWVACGIGFSFLGGCIFLFVTSTSINMLSLFGFLITTGIIVDDAIVIGESFSRLSKKGLAPKDAAMKTLQDLAWPVFAMMSTTLLAFVPLLYVSGIMGKFISVLPIAVIGALIFSLFESLTILPVHLTHHSNLIKNKDNKILTIVYNIQRKIEESIEKIIDRLLIPTVNFCITNHLSTVIIIGSMVIISVSLVSSGIVKVKVFPKVDGEIVSVNFSLLPGNSKETTTNYGKQILAALEGVREKIKKSNEVDIVDDYLMIIGSKLQMRRGGNASFSPNIGQIQLELVSAKNGRNIEANTFINMWRSVVPKHDDLHYLYFATQSGPSSNRPISVTFKSTDTELIKVVEKQFVNYLSSIQGVFDVGSDGSMTIPTVNVKLKEFAHKLPLTEMSIIEDIKKLYNGIVVDTFYKNEDEIKVIARLPQRQRDSIEKLKQIPLYQSVTIEQVADVEQIEEVSSISRVDGSRQVNVYASVDDSQGVNEVDVRNKMEEEFLRNIPKKVFWNYDGETEDGNKAIKSLVTGFIPTFLAIYFILATLFKSYLQPIIIMAAIPLGIIGTIWGHAIMSQPINLMSAFGIISLAGIVVNDSLVLVDAINKLAGDNPLKVAITKAIKLRFRSISLTTVTTVAGMFPLLFETSLQARFLIPFAISLIFGIPVSSVLILIVIPIAYSYSKIFSKR